MQTGLRLIHMLVTAVMVVVCHPDWPLQFIVVLVEVSVFFPALAKLVGMVAMCQLLPYLTLGLLSLLLFPTLHLLVFFMFLV